MNEIEKYNRQLSWYAPLTRINLSIHGMRALVLQGALLTITSIALGVILAQNGSFTAALAHQKIAMITLLTTAALQCLKLGANTYSFNRKKNIQEAVKAEIEILFPSKDNIAKDPNHLYSKLPGTLKSIVIEYVDVQDLTTVCYLMNEFGCPVSNYQNYWKQRLGASSWEDIPTVFTDFFVALNENEAPHWLGNVDHPIEWLRSFDSLDNTIYFAKFFWGWECLSRTCEYRIDMHLPILTRFFTHDPEKVFPVNSWLTYGIGPYTIDIMQNSNEELISLVLQRGLVHAKYFHVACSVSEKTALLIFRKFTPSEINHTLPIVCLHGYAELLEEYIQRSGCNLNNWSCLDSALLGALFQKKILAQKKISLDSGGFVRSFSHFSSLEITEVMKGNYRKTISLLVQNGVDIHTLTFFLPARPLNFARQHPELAEYIPILEGREVV